MPLSPKQASGLQLMVAGKSNGDIAHALQVRPETVSRWRQLPAFVDALQSANDPSLVAADVNVTFAKWRAYDVLLALLDSDDDQIRLKAAAAIYSTWGTALPTYRGPDAEPKSDEEATHD